MTKYSLLLLIEPFNDVPRHMGTTSSTRFRHRYRQLLRLLMMKIAGPLMKLELEYVYYIHHGAYDCHGYYDGY